MKQELSLEQKELVAVAASVGAGCQPCASHHLKAGANAGLEGERLLAAVTSAERVSAEAAVAMGDHVRGKLGPGVASPALLSRLEEALASLGAALGANDAKNIERQLRAALELGASRSQLQQAIKTAHTVQENAARIHVREAERLLDSLAQSVAPAVNEAASGNGCGCGAEHEPEAAPGEAETPHTEATSNEGSGCGSKDGSDTEAASTTTSELAAGFAGPMRGLFGGAGTREAGMAAAMANGRRMFEAAFGPAATPAETNEPSAATEAAGSCKKEV
jgi:AhpD family alkylhydroperoxidase